VGTGTQGGPLALRRRRSADGDLCILSQTATARRKLSKVQRLACLGVTGAIRTTPTGAMETLVGLPL